MSWYDVDGIFLDAMGNQDGDLDYVGLYASIQELASEAGVELHVVGNPGIPFEQVESYIPAADTLVIFEGPLQNADPNGASFVLYPKKGPYTGLVLWFLNYNSSQFANIVYDVSTPLKMLGSMAKALVYNAGYVYLTNGELPNPYGALPPYWDLEVDLIELLNGL